MAWDRAKKKKVAIAIGVVLLGITMLSVGFAILYWGESSGWLFDIFDWLQLHDNWGKLIVALVFIPTNFPFVVGYAILTLAAGFLFGFWWGMVTVIIGNQLGIFAVFTVVNLFFKKSTENVICIYFLKI